MPAPAKKTTAKKTAKKAAASRTKTGPTAPAPKAARKVRVDDTPAPGGLTPGTAMGTVDVPLSALGEHTGKTRTLTLLAPTQDQYMWAEAAYYRMNLALTAANEGEEFDQNDRGRIFSELRRLTGVFLSPWETDWCEDALSSGQVQLADMWVAMGDAFTRAGGDIEPVGEDDDEDIVIA
jgi:hypothetical protein